MRKWTFKWTYRKKLTALFFILSIAPLAGSTTFFLLLYKGEKLAALFENELTNTLQAANRLEYLLAISKTLEVDRVRESKDFILLMDDPCRAFRPAPPRIFGPQNNPILTKTSSEFSNGVVSAYYEKTLQRLKLQPEDWRKAKALVETCRTLKGNLPETPIFLEDDPELPIPYIQVLTKRAPSDRLLTISMDGLGGSSGQNRYFITDRKGSFLWNDGCAEDLSKVKPIFSEIAKFAELATSSGIPSITRIGKDKIVAYAPIAPGWVLFSMASESEALAPVRFVLTQSILLALGSLFIYLLAGKFAAARLSAPLNQLRETSEAFGAGNLTSRIQVEGNDEISVVQGTFNSMADRIVKLLQDTKASAAMAADMAIASKVQQWFFPKQGTQVTGHQMFAHMQMATKCGGDWWGYIELPNGQGAPLVLLMIGDAAGHGISSALLTAATQGALAVLKDWTKENPDLARDPRMILRILNQVIFRTSGGEIHMSFFVAVLDADAKEMRVANAGHNKPYLVKPRKDVPGQPATPAQIKPVGTASSVLGEKPDEPFDEIETFPWEENDQLFLYTDGLIDCLFDGKELFSRRSLVHLLTKHAHLKGDALVQEIIRTRRSMIGAIPQEDDVTAVVCLRSPPKKTADPANSGGQA